MNLPKTKDTIFIGAIKLTDETGGDYSIKIYGQI